jgi:hypothetical protein
LLDLLLLLVFVLLNYFALRWTARQLIADGQWLRVDRFAIHQQWPWLISP